MDERMKKRKEKLEKESEIVESSSNMIGKSSLYRMLPNKEGSVFDNRIIILLWRPGVVCPELFSDYYSEDDWDFKAAVVGHYIVIPNQMGGKDTYFVVCKPGMADYYSKFLGKEIEKGECDFCAENEKRVTRYLFQVFDYQKLIGERELDEGEDRPYVQILIGPTAIYNGLWSKFKVDVEFWDKRITRITKDTKKGVRYSDYTVEVEGTEPEELSDEILSYLQDESNHINPVKEELIKMSMDDVNKASEARKERRGLKGGESTSNSKNSTKKKINW